MLKTMSKITLTGKKNGHKCCIFKEDIITIDNDHKFLTKCHTNQTSRSVIKS